MIRAKGKKNGKTVAVEYKDEIFTFNGKIDPALEQEMLMLMEEKRPIGGTYYAEYADDPLNIVEVMRSYFFDKPVRVETDEHIEEMPFEEGVVY